MPDARPRWVSAGRRHAMADDPFERVPDCIAGHSVTAIILVSDPKSSLSAAGHALIETAKDVPQLLAAVRNCKEGAGGRWPVPRRGRACPCCARPGASVTRGPGPPGCLGGPDRRRRDHGAQVVLRLERQERRADGRRASAVLGRCARQAAQTALVALSRFAGRTAGSSRNRWKCLRPLVVSGAWRKRRRR
jgi:hypothetical protein